MKNLLFVTPKWCDAKPSLSLTNDYHNFFNTFSRSRPDYHYDILHLDEAILTYGSHIDKVLVDYCSKNEINIILFSLIGIKEYNPSKETYKKLREMGIYLVVLWPDTGPGWGLQTIQDLKDDVHLHVSYDSPKSPYHDSYPKLKNHIETWTPEDDTLFYKIENKDIDVSFLGSLNLYRDRIGYLNILKDKCPMVISGGQRQVKLSPEQYASLIRRSKIGINFPLSQTGVFWQAKGRIFEYTACGSMLLDMVNPATASFFEPNKDYIEFNSPEDLIEKINYYLSHKEERLIISNNGYKKFNDKYTAKIFWDNLLNIIENNIKNEKH
jgi:glycosyltransferase involved in cell wall biosynthesis